MGEVTGTRSRSRRAAATPTRWAWPFSNRRTSPTRTLARLVPFTLELAIQGAFSADVTEQKMARIFITDALGKAGNRPRYSPRRRPAAPRWRPLSPSPDYMFWFEYISSTCWPAADARRRRRWATTPLPVNRQRARFYSVSEEGRLNFAKGIARYIVLLSENTGLATAERCATALARLPATSG